MYGLVFDYYDGTKMYPRKYERKENARKTAWAEFRSGPSARRVHIIEINGSSIRYLEYYDASSFYDGDRIKGYTDTKRGTEYFYVDKRTGKEFDSMPPYMHDAWSW